MKLLVGAGGTGGHIIPAIAIALEMSSRNWEVAFIGNKNCMEENLVKSNGFLFKPIRVQKIYRELTFEHFKFPFLFIYSLCRCLIFIWKYNPDAVLCTGGYVSGPVALSSIILGKRLYFQDGNSYPGLTTRLMARYSRHVFTASNDAKKYLKKSSCVFTGNPILKYQAIDKNQQNWSELNLTPDTKKIFVIGGSQGSVVVNKVIGECVDEILSLGIELIWQTGKPHLDYIAEKFKDSRGIHCFGFTDKMSDYYQMADFAISRAGALSIAELEEHKVPTIFIPLPTSAENHQFKNAKSQEQKGVGKVLEQKLLTPVSLLKSIEEMMSDNDKYINKLAQVPKNNATNVISDIIVRETAKSREQLC